jgi:hypothetical protein
MLTKPVAKPITIPLSVRESAQLLGTMAKGVPEQEAVDLVAKQQLVAAAATRRGQRR